MPPVIEPWKWVVLTIAQEAMLEPFEGKVAVAEVIRNRMRDKYNSDGTEVGTVLKPFQFSGWNTSNFSRIDVSQLDLTHAKMIECIQAYNVAFLENSDAAFGANLYHADWMNPYPVWTHDPKVTKVTQIGKHIFYKEIR